MLRALWTLLLCTLYGALGAGMVRFLYVSYTLMSEGAGREAITRQALLLEPFQIREFVLLGAGGGLVVGLMILLIGLLGRIVERIRRPEIDAAPQVDTNAVLQADRERRVEQYMAGRES